MNAVVEGIKHISEITKKLENQQVKGIPEFPKKVRGLDDRLYLQFQSSYELEIFLIGLGIDPYQVSVFNVGGYENGLLINEL